MPPQQSDLKRKSRRLVVRPLCASDYIAWKSAYSTILPKQNLWDNAANLATSELTRAKFRKKLALQKKNRTSEAFITLAIFTLQGELIGWISYMNISRGISQSAYLGYSLLNRHWRNGYAKEAVKISFDIAFRDLKLHRVEAGIEPTNRRSHALARSLGMRREGLKKRSLFLRGKWVDLSVYALTCEDLGYKFRGPKPIHSRR